VEEAAARAQAQAQARAVAQAQAQAERAKAAEAQAQAQAEAEAEAEAAEAEAKAAEVEAQAQAQEEANGQAASAAAAAALASAAAAHAAAANARVNVNARVAPSAVAAQATGGISPTTAAGQAASAAARLDPNESAAAGAAEISLAQTASQRVRSARSQPSDFDLWWEQRRARNTLHNGQLEARPTAQDGPLPFDVESVGLVLSAFVRSEYARQVCNVRNLEPTEHGRVDGMFEKVQLGEAKLVLRLKRVFGERNTHLLERLALYLRAKIPQIKQVHALHRDGMDIY
jgi:hypothetical protein